jgi:hypothetical protein
VSPTHGSQDHAVSDELTGRTSTRRAYRRSIRRSFTPPYEDQPGRTARSIHPSCRKRTRTATRSPVIACRR